ncbi:hypothetical protein C6A85_15045, partial [Mycobacterium sp. ITM-2017-0098]
GFHVVGAPFPIGGRVVELRGGLLFHDSETRFGEQSLQRRGGRVGLLVYLATRHIPDDELPEGNHFPTAASLEGLFAESGFAV